jgi:hypothetical protein
MEVAQVGVCAICGRTNPGRKRLAVDHCHDCEGIDGRGSVRPGLLCSSCNTGRFYGTDAEVRRQQVIWAARFDAHQAVCPADTRSTEEDRLARADSWQQEERDAAEGTDTNI